MKSGVRNNILLGGFLLLHIFLAFYKLDKIPMWDDEASVVWFAKNYNTYHKVVGYDGTNIFSYRNGSLLNNQLSYNNPPLDIYYTSYVIRYIGDDDFTIRASYVIVGIFSLVIFLCCLKHLTGNNEKWFMYTAVILIFSLNYLMPERNTRYYALNFLFGSLSLLATLKITTAKTHLVKIGLLLFQVFCLYMLFLSHYLDALCWWMMCFFIMLSKKTIRFSFRHGFNYLAAVLYITLAIIIYRYISSHHVFDRPDLDHSDPPHIKYFKLLGWLFNDLNRSNVIPVWTVFLLIYFFIRKKHLLSPDFKQVVYISLVFLGLIYLVDPQNTAQSQCFEIRYLYIIFPVLYLIPGYLLSLLHEKTKQGRILAPFLLLVFINSTLLSYIPVSTPPRSLLPNYIIEKVQPYPTAYSEVIPYIEKHFDTRKKILTLPEFHNTVFLRYFSEKIEITNTLDSNTTHLSRQLIDSLGLECLYIGKCKPDYVFLFGAHYDKTYFPDLVSQYTYIDTLRVYAKGNDISRPEIPWHTFGPEKDFDIHTEALYILHN